MTWRLKPCIDQSSARNRFPRIGSSSRCAVLSPCRGGGVDVDVTTIVHADNIGAALQAAKLFELQVPGVDRFIDDGRVPIEVFQTELEALEFQKQQSEQGKRCYLTWADKTIDSVLVRILLCR